MKLEKKLSKYAIKNLPMIMIGCYVLGYILAFIDKQNIILNMICLNPYRIMHGQGSMRIINANEIVREAFQVTGVDNIIDIR